MKTLKTLRWCSRADHLHRGAAGANGKDFAEQQAALSRRGRKIHESLFGKNSELDELGLGLSWLQATSRCLRDAADEDKSSTWRRYRGRMQRTRQLVANAKALRAGGKALKDKVVEETKRLQSEHNGASGGIAGSNLRELAALNALPQRTADQEARVVVLRGSESADTAACEETKRKMHSGLRTHHMGRRTHTAWLELGRIVMMASKQQRETFAYDCITLQKLAACFDGPDCKIPLYVEPSHGEMTAAAPAAADEVTSAAPPAAEMTAAAPPAAQRGSSRLRERAVKAAQSAKSDDDAQSAPAQPPDETKRNKSYNKLRLPAREIQRRLIAAEAARQDGRLPTRICCVSGRCIFGNQVRNDVPGLCFVQCDACDHWHHSCCVGQPEVVVGGFTCPVCVDASAGATDADADDGAGAGFSVGGAGVSICGAGGGAGGGAGICGKA